MIELPNNWQTYTDSVKTRCFDLIDYKIWNGLNKYKLQAWLRNFKTEEEKFFSAKVLDSLIYRSNAQTFSLIHQLLFRNLNNLFRSLCIPDLQNFPLCLCDHNVDPLVRFIPVITRFDPVTKSSNEVLRFMKRYFHISECWISNPWNINRHIADGIKAIIFIDDFLGTGKQFDDVCINENLKDVIDKSLIIYAPLVAHESGISFLLNEYPKLKITFTEKLEYRLNSFFLNYFPENPENAKTFYDTMLKNRYIEFGSDNKYGYGNLELTYAFEHASPDNSLAILHLRHDNWNQLFNR